MTTPLRSSSRAPLSLFSRWPLTTLCCASGVVSLAVLMTLGTDSSEEELVAEVDTIEAVEAVEAVEAEELDEETELVAERDGDPADPASVLDLAALIPAGPEIVAMGKPHAKAKSGLYAMKGPKDAIPSMARGGAFAVGSDDGEVWGGLGGSEIGEAYGVGGLGLVGTGRGGGGTGEGTIGLGSGSGYGRGGGGLSSDTYRTAHYDRAIQARSLTAGVIDDNADPQGYRKAMKELSRDRERLGIDDKLWHLDAPTQRHVDAPTSLDVALVIDTTGSMGDELEYLKVEIREIAEGISTKFPGVDQRWAMVVYRDHGDAYVVRSADFRALDAFVDELGKQRAGGGGDMPEAMDLAMVESADLSWRRGDETARMVFLVADAPSHAGKGARRYARALLDHRSAKTAVYPIASSGVAGMAEAEMRLAAKITGGQYIFLTNHSGIGGHHEEAHVDSYKVESLHDAMARMIDEELGGDARAELIRATPVPEVEATPEREACGAEAEELAPAHAAVELERDDDPNPSLWDALMERLMAHLLFASTMSLLLLAAIGADSLIRRRRSARG